MTLRGIEARLSLPALRQWPPGGRQVASADHRRCSSIHVDIARVRTRPISIICRLILVQHASATHGVGRSCRGTLLLPAIVISTAQGFRVIQLYQGVVRAFQR
jgi:hypothetical protein